MKAEFKIGDTITYKPYERAFEREITDIVEEDGDILYHFDMHLRFPVRCTGKCIVESKLYEEYDPAPDVMTLYNSYVDRPEIARQLRMTLPKVDLIIDKDQS